MSYIVNGLGDRGLSAIAISLGSTGFTLAQFNISRLGQSLVPGFLGVGIVFILGIILAFILAFIAKWIMAGILKRLGLERRLSRLTPRTRAFLPYRLRNGSQILSSGSSLFLR